MGSEPPPATPATPNSSRFSHLDLATTPFFFRIVFPVSNPLDAQDPAFGAKTNTKK